MSSPEFKPVTSRDTNHRATEKPQERSYVLLKRSYKILPYSTIIRNMTEGNIHQQKYFQFRQASFTFAREGV